MSSADAGLEHADHAGREAAVDQLAVAGVVGRVHVEHEVPGHRRFLLVDLTSLEADDATLDAADEKVPASRLQMITSACFVTTQKPGPSGSGW